MFAFLCKFDIILHFWQAKVFNKLPCGFFSPLLFGLLLGNSDESAAYVRFSYFSSYQRTLNFLSSTPMVGCYFRGIQVVPLESHYRENSTFCWSQRNLEENAMVVNFGALYSKRATRVKSYLQPEIKTSILSFNE